MTAQMPYQSPGPIEQVRIGMRVVDRNGDEIGRVEDVKMGDPEAVTPRGQSLNQGDGLLGALAQGLGGGPDLPQQLSQRLLRTGFVQVDGKGWFSGDLYASPDDIAEVAGDDVQLAVTRDQLISGR